MNKANILPFTTLFILSVVLCLNFSQSPIYNYFIDDSSIYQYIGSLILKGSMPYRDIFDHKGPIVYLYHALGQYLHPLNGQFYLEIISIFIASIFAFKIANIYNSKIISLLIISLILANIPALDTFGNTEIQSWPFLFYITLQFIQTINNSKTTPKTSFFLGLSVGFLSLIKFNYLLYPFFMLLTIFIILLKNKEFLLVKKYILFGVLGFISILIPTFLWLYINNALYDFYENYIVFNLFYASKNSNFERIIYCYNFLIQIPFVKYSLYFPIPLICFIKFYSPKERLISLSSIFLYYLTLFSLVFTGNPYIHYALLFYPLTFVILSLIISKIKYQSISILLLIVSSFYFANNSYIRSSVYKKNCTYNTAKMKEISHHIQNYLSENETFLYLGELHALPYLYSNRQHSNLYAYNFIVKNIMPEKFQENFKSFPPNLILTQKNNIHEFNIDLSQYQLIYFDGTFLIYALPSFVATKNTPFICTPNKEPNNNR